MSEKIDNHAYNQEFLPKIAGYSGRSPKTAVLFAMPNS